jgi:hypothetical protein
MKVRCSNYKNCLGDSCSHAFLHKKSLTCGGKCIFNEGECSPTNNEIRKTKMKQLFNK